MGVSTYSKSFYGTIQEVRTNTEKMFLIDKTMLFQIYELRKIAVNVQVLFSNNSLDAVTEEASTKAIHIYISAQANALKRFAK